MIRAARRQMMGKKNRTGKRLRLVPLILGGYGAFLGLGLAVIGLAEIKEGIGIARFLVGLGMAYLALCFSGISDIRPLGFQKMPPK